MFSKFFLIAGLSDLNRRSYPGHAAGLLMIANFVTKMELSQIALFFYYKTCNKKVHTFRRKKSRIDDKKEGLYRILNNFSIRSDLTNIHQNDLIG